MLLLLLLLWRSSCKDGWKICSWGFPLNVGVWRAKIYWPGPKEDYPSDRILVTIKPLKDFHSPPPPTTTTKKAKRKPSEKAKAKQKPFRRQMK